MESFIGWIGGKRMLRKAILERFPTDEVGRYIEVFGGAAFRQGEESKPAGGLQRHQQQPGEPLPLCEVPLRGTAARDGVDAYLTGAVL